MGSKLVTDSRTPHSNLCKICVELHPITDLCKYDRLQKIVFTLRKQIENGSKAYAELKQIAVTFQDIIRQMTPNFEALDDDFELLKKCCAEHPEGKVILDVFESRRFFNGPKDLQTETPEQQREGIQSQESPVSNVRQPVEEISTKVS